MKPRKTGGRRRMFANRVLLGVALDASMKAGITKAAKDRGFSTSNFVRTLIKKFLDADSAKRAAEPPAHVPPRVNHRRQNNWWPISRPAAGGAQ